MIKKLANRLFKWFCRDPYYLDIRGDLEENYFKHLETYSRRKSDWLYLMEVLLLFRPSIFQLKIKLFNNSTSGGMIKNYLKIALRNLKRQKAYTGVNILGLSIGIVSLFYILIFIESEVGYDKHHKDLDRLFRVTTESVINGDSLEGSTSPPGLRGRILDNMAEVEVTARFMNFLGIDKNILQYEDQLITETKGYLADPEFFDIFHYPIVYGNKASLLEEPQMMVLSKTLADKFFPDRDPTGESITIINNYGTSSYLVTGVYDNEQVQSHINPAFICSMNSGSIGNYAYNNDRLVGNNFLFTYVKLFPEVDPKTTAAKIQGLIREHVEEARNAHGFVALSDIYLYSSSQNQTGVGGDIRYIYILITIAILILSIACINFANMATAQASKRAKEIGLRKTFGAKKKMIIAQFLGESVIITFFAMAVSIAVIFLLTGPFHSLTGKEVHPITILEKVPILILITILTSLLAGSYPAFYLSSLKLKSTLGNQGGKHAGSLVVRKVLVTFQFIVGILLIVGSLTTVRQLQYIQAKPLGFKSANQLVVPLQSQDVVRELEKVKTTFLRIPGVDQVSGTTYSPAQFVLSDNLFSISRGSVDDGVIIRQNDVDFNLIETLGIDVVAGRTFNKDRANESKTVVLNEAAVSALGMTNEEILEQEIHTVEEGPVSYKVIGVVKDFHSQSLHKEIEPYLFAMREGNEVSSVIVSIDGNDYQKTLSRLEEGWDELFPSLPFQFQFLDQELKAQYETDNKFGQIIVLFTGVALILCLIGIFALTAFTVQESLKEISIRKVLGASVNHIFSSLASRFLLLVLIAAVISIPLGIVLMEKWLDLFAYRITPGLVSVFVPIAVIFVSTLVVISHKIFFVARINPARILRSD